MKKKVSILVTVLLVLVLSLSIVLSACGEKDPAPTPTPTPGPGDDPTTPVTPVDPYAGMSHAESSSAAYVNALDEFYQVYSEARAEITDLDKRYALMAVAEAKLLASNVSITTSPSAKLAKNSALTCAVIAVLNAFTTSSAVV